LPNHISEFPEYFFTDLYVLWLYLHKGEKGIQRKMKKKKTKYVTCKCPFQRKTQHEIMILMLMYCKQRRINISCW